MITEDYVSFETAKLLKEKGFEPPHDFRKCIPIMYTDKGEIKWGVWSDDWYPRITLQMAMKWLRKVHNLHCDIGYDDLDWFWNILNISESVPVEERPRMIKDGSAGFKSYEEAAEAAIKYCLENLI